jgi:hypothetical protein
MDRITVGKIWLLAAVPPLLTAVAWIGALAVTAVTGTHPIWTLTARNAAEAAAFRDAGAVVRFVKAGHDINAAGQVRGGIIRSDTALMTPVEAAAAARQREMLQVLLDLGATPDALVWQRAYCISDADSVRDLLEANRPPGATDDCEQ